MEDKLEEKLILAFVSDLMFAVQIEQVAGRSGLRSAVIESVGRMLELAGYAVDTETGDEVKELGALAQLLDLKKPALVIFDINNDQVPWRSWIKWIADHPGEREIPIVCFGSHVEVERMKAARDAGATQVLARSRFVQVMPELFDSVG